MTIEVFIKHNMPGHDKFVEVSEVMIDSDGNQNQGKILAILSHGQEAKITIWNTKELRIRETS